MTEKHVKKIWKILRWIARVWSLAIFVFVLFMVFSEDPYATGEPLSIKDYVLLGLWGCSTLGLMLAWLWEFPGAVIAIVALAMRDLLYIILNDRWEVSFLMIWALFLPPAVMYLFAWRYGNKSKVS